MKCKDCIYFGVHPTPICAISYCYQHGFVADPDEDGACEDGELIESEVEK